MKMWANGRMRELKKQVIRFKTYLPVLRRLEYHIKSSHSLYNFGYTHPITNLCVVCNKIYQCPTVFVIESPLYGCPWHSSAQQTQTLYLKNCWVVLEPLTPLGKTTSTIMKNKPKFSKYFGMCDYICPI